jgi:hypothetical protein
VHQPGIAACPLAEAHYHSNRQDEISEKLHGEKRCWPHLWVCCLPRGGHEGNCQYPAHWVPPRTSFKSRQTAEHATTHHHVSRGTRPTGRALERNVSRDSRSRLPMARAPGSRASCSPLWVVGLKHKEKPSRPACAARLTYSQCTCARFQGV